MVKQIVTMKTQYLSQIPSMVMPSMQGEQYCKYFEHHNQLRIHILSSSFLFTVIMNQIPCYILWFARDMKTKKLSFLRKPDHSYNFLNTKDVSHFIYLLMHGGTNLW